MRPPKAVVFDLGKVLLDFDYAIAARNLAPRISVQLPEVQQLINQSPLLHQYETGLLSTDEFFDRVRKLAGFRGDLAEFAGLFADIFSEIPAMVATHARLRHAGVPTYLFSNTNDLTIRHIRRHFPFFSQFDGHVLSYEHRAMKPDPRLYEVLEGVARLRGPDLFYLDDRPENVAAGLARGWQALVHETPEASTRALVQAGLLRPAG